jgi:predicted nucleic acid-binding Zn ribbon protein
MKRTNTAGIAQIINQVIDEYKIGDKLMEARIIAAWSQVLGPLAKPSDELYIKNRTLFVRLSSSVIRNELSMMRTQLVQRLNEQVGEGVITDIVFR